MRLFDKFRLTVEALGSLRRPAVPLSMAQARYDPMVQSLADALAAEFGVTWTEEEKAALDKSGRHWEYTTSVLVADQPLDVFPDWSSRYQHVVQSVAQVDGQGTHSYDPTTTPHEPNLDPPERYMQQTARGIEELELINLEGIGPSRTTRDAIGGDIELDLDEGRTRIQISVKVVATN